MMPNDVSLLEEGNRYKCQRISSFKASDIDHNRSSRVNIAGELGGIFHKDQDRL